MKNFSVKDLKNKFFDYLSDNHYLRRLKSILDYKIFPFFLKSFLAFLVIVIIAFFALKAFKPAYLDKIYQKTFLYFFHYLNLDNQAFSKVIITGNKRATTEQINAIISEVQHEFDQNKLKQNGDETYEPLIKTLITQIKVKAPWVHKITITRTMPNIINIAITEYEPFAIWQDGDKKYVTDKDGNIVLVDNIEEFNHLVILSGKGANTYAKSLFNIFAIDPVLSARVYSATWLGGRRWDIRFDNGLLIKLPENNISDAWRSLIKIYNMPGSIVGLKIIDLRIEGRVYLEYGDSVIKELHNL